jgi:hypothetical protein
MAKERELVYQEWPLWLGGIDYADEARVIYIYIYK